MVALNPGTEPVIGSRHRRRTFLLATYGMPLAELEGIQAVVSGTAAEVTATLGRYVAAGARHVVVRLAALDFRSQYAQLERMAALLPALRADPPPQSEGLSPLSASGSPRS